MRSTIVLSRKLNFCNFLYNCDILGEKLITYKDKSVHLVALYLGRIFTQYITGPTDLCHAIFHKIGCQTKWYLI